MWKSGQFWLSLHKLRSRWLPQEPLIFLKCYLTYAYLFLFGCVLYVCVYTCACMCLQLCLHAIVYMWTVRDNLYLQSCGFWGLNSVVGLGSQCPYLPAHLFIPTFSLESGSFAGLEFPKQAVPRNYPHSHPLLPLPPQDWDYELYTPLHDFFCRS